MYAQAPKEFGRIDVLFNNAGISPDDDASVLDTSLEAWQRVQDVNLKSVFLCCKHGIPHLLEAGGGSVINTASFVAVMGAADLADLLHRLEGRRAGAVARARRRVRPPRRPRQRPLPGRREHARCSRSCSRRTRSRPRAGWSTCRSAASPSPARSPRPPSSWPATTRATSPPRPSSSTAASRAPTSPPNEHRGV